MKVFLKGWIIFFILVSIYLWTSPNKWWNEDTFTVYEIFCSSFKSINDCDKEIKTLRTTYRSFPGTQKLVSFAIFIPREFDECQINNSRINCKKHKNFNIKHIDTCQVYNAKNWVCLEYGSMNDGQRFRMNNVQSYQTVDRKEYLWRRWILLQ